MYRLLLRRGIALRGFAAASTKIQLPETVVGFLKGVGDEAQSMRSEIASNGKKGIGRYPVQKWMQLVEQSLIFCGEALNAILDTTVEVEGKEDEERARRVIMQGIRGSCTLLFEGLCDLVETHQAFNYKEELEMEEEKILYDMVEDMLGRYFFVVRKFGQDKEAIEVFEKFVEKHVPISLEVFDEILDMFDKVDMHEDILGVADIIHERKLVFSPKALEICLHAACNVDGAAAVKILKDAYDQGNDCDESVIGPVVHRCIVQGDMESAIEAMKVSQIDRFTDPLFYDNLIKDTLSVNDDQFAIEVIPYLKNLENIEGLSRECIQNVVLVCLNAGDFNRAFQVMDLLLEMLKNEDISEQYFDKKSEKKSKKISPIYLFEYVLHVLRTAKNDLFVKNVLMQMRYFNVELAPGTFGALIKCLSEIGDVEECKRLVQEAKEFNSLQKEEKNKIEFDKEIFVYLLACCDNADAPTDWVEEELKKFNWTRWDVENFFYETEKEDDQEFDLRSKDEEQEHEEEEEEEEFEEDEDENGAEEISDSEIQLEEEDFEEEIDHGEQDERTLDLLEKYSKSQ